MGSFSRATAPSSRVSAFHHSSLPKTFVPLFRLCIALVLLSVIGTASPCRADAAATGPVRQIVHEQASLPGRYGEVIFRINENSASQLYIIGISHRDPADGRNNSDTVRTQTEIYRIGEWLNQQMGLELLLPEGYFGERSGSAPSFTASNRADLSPGLSPGRLAARLADESRFVNAEMLLMEHFDMRASQVEDRDIYNAVKESLRGLQTGGANRSRQSAGIARLQELQAIRTDRMLQKIPAVIEEERLHGTIRNRSAMFTIGLYHLNDIIRHLEGKPLEIGGEPSPANDHVSSPIDSDLIKLGYGVTIILPRTLADNRDLLELMQLDRLLPARPGISISASL